MGLLELSHNDDIRAVVQKCNLNFRQLADSIRQAVGREGRSIETDVSQMISTAISGLIDTTIPNEVALQISNANIPGQITAEVGEQLIDLDIPGLVNTAVADALSMEITNTLSDFFTEDGCTVTACNAMRWGSMACIRFSYRLNSALTVPSNGDVADVTLGKLKIGWRPYDMTNVLLDQTKIIVGDVGSNGDVKIRSANSRGASYTIDENTVLYASMTLMLGIQ